MKVKRKERLFYENDWERHVYKIGNVRLKTLTRVQINTKVYPVSLEKDCRHYSDHGQANTVVSDRYYISVNIHGKPIRQYLDVLLESKMVIKVLVYLIEVGD